MLQDGVEALQQIAEFVRRERPAARFRLNNYLGTHLQVVTDLNAEGPAEAILEIVEILIGHAATPESVSLRSTHPRRPALEAEHAMLSLPASMRDRSAPQNGLSAAKQRATRRRTAPVMAHSEHALCAAHRSNIREWYCDHAPRPNTWPLNIEPLGRFRPQRDFLSARSTSCRSVARLPHTSGQVASLLRQLVDA